ncbi:MAG TPA: protein kinase, partial [Thermoanaerobaculia bacterium]|nr:protein kinase [Thermoanaerobaculia bacterium]
MPLILVVEQDDRVAGRVRRALEPAGWSVAHAPGVTQAMQAVASEAPDLFLVAADLEGAGKVLASFARRQGGPGTVALVAEEVPAAPGGLPAGAARDADASLPRAFDAAALRAVVERVLGTGDRPPARAGGGPKLTSEDIFGDLVAEVEGGAEPFPDPRPAPPQPPKRRAAAAAPSPERPAPPRRPPGDAEIERKLEQTLSGVLGWVPKAKPVPPPRSGAPDPPSPATGDLRPPRRDTADVDKLLSDTLSGLELGPGRPKRDPAPPPPPSSSPPAREGFGLSDLEALIARPRRAPAAERATVAKPAADAVPSAGDAPPAPQPIAAAPPPIAEPPIFDLPPVEAAAEPIDSTGAAGAAEPPGPSPPAGAGTEFGQYRLLERIGVGGMAEVWKARMTGVEGFQKTVAIKRILPHLTDSPDFVEMFVDEAKLAAQLNHANVIHIYDLGKIGDDYYIAMEHVDGENL